MGGDYHSAPNPLLLPLLTRGDRKRMELQVVNFVPGATQFAVVRQTGVPVHELALSSRFSLGAYFELKKIVTEFRPDVLHAWGATAQWAALKTASRGKKKKPIPVVWSISRSTPLSSKAGFLDKWAFNLSKKLASRCQHIVYPSASASAQHRRAGLPEDLSTIIAPGVDVDRFKPDPAARQRMRDKLKLHKDAILVGMYAPFAPEYDHATFIKAIGDLIKINANVYCILAGRAMTQGNAALMALVGGGTVGSHTHLLGEWSDLGALFNACDIVCSSALTDSTRFMLATAMLCGVPCVGTGLGAQGEIMGGYGVSVEQGSPEAITRGMRRMLEMPSERKAFMLHSARRHILQNYNMARSIERVQALYIELLTGVAPQLSSLPDEPMPVRAPAANAAATLPTNAAPVDTGATTPSSNAALATGATPTVMAPTPSSAPVSEQPAQQIAEPPRSTPAAAPAKPFDEPFNIDAVEVKAPKIEHEVQENMMEWSASDAELINAVGAGAPAAAAPAADTTAMTPPADAKQFELSLVEAPASEPADPDKKDAAA